MNDSPTTKFKVHLPKLTQLLNKANPTFLLKDFFWENANKLGFEINEDKKRTESPNRKWWDTLYGAIKKLDLSNVGNSRTIVIDNIHSDSYDEYIKSIKKHTNIVHHISAKFKKTPVSKELIQLTLDSLNLPPNLIIESAKKPNSNPSLKSLSVRYTTA